MQNQSPYNILYIAALSFVMLLPWTFMQLDIRVSADAAYLFTGAQSFLHGLPMKEYYFDNNPPLCYLIYLPAVFLSALGIPPYLAITIYSFALIALAALSLALSLHHKSSYDGLDKLLIFCGFLLGVTFIPLQEFGQKDHFIAIALLAFLLLQRILPSSTGVTKIIIIAGLALWTPFILIKPHFGLLPALLIAYDFYKSKNLLIIFRADFICLAIGTLLYAFITAYFFPDYISDILPLAMELYVPAPIGANTTKHALVFLGVGIALAMMLWCDDKLKDKDDKILFAVMTIAATIPFWIQNKGFTLHMLPIIPFLVISILFAMRQIIPDIIGGTYLIKSALIMILIFGCGYLTTAVQRKPATHTMYAQSPLAKLIQEKAGDQPFVFESYSTNIFYSQALYLENTIGSRFSSFWLLSSIAPIEDKDKKRAYLNDFCNMLADDLERFKPKLVALREDEEGENLLTVSFLEHERVQDVWKKYRRDGEFTLHESDMGDFFEKDKSKQTFGLYILTEDE